MPDSSTLAKKGCFRISTPNILSSGFFFISPSIKETASFDKWEGNYIFSTYVNNNIRSWFFSLSIYGLCDRKEPYQPIIRKPWLLGTKDPQLHRIKPLPKFLEPHSRKCRNKFSFDQCRRQPTQSHKASPPHSTWQYSQVWCLCGRFHFSEDRLQLNRYALN